MQTFNLTATISLIVIATLLSVLGLITTGEQFITIVLALIYQKI